MDSAGSDRQQRRTALVDRELGRYGIQIAALSMNRFADVGKIKEVGAGYTFFWSERKSEERREAGVGFAIKIELVARLSGLPICTNDRLMTLRLPLAGNKHAAIVSVYARLILHTPEYLHNGKVQCHEIRRSYKHRTNNQKCFLQSKTVCAHAWIHFGTGSMKYLPLCTHDDKSKCG